MSTKTTKKTATKQRRKYCAGDFGCETAQKTILWARTISDLTAQKIDKAVSKDEYVAEYGKKDAHLIDKVLCLEIKRWKVVVQLTDKIVRNLDDKELFIVCHGNNVEDDGHTRYLFRSLCAKHMIDTSYLGVANSRQKKASYYSAKKFKATGKKNKLLMINDLAARLAGEYLLRAGTNNLAREIVADIIGEVKAIAAESVI